MPTVATALPTADLSPEHLEQLVVEYVSPVFIARAEAAGDRARVLAYMIELARDFERLETTLGVLVEADSYENGGTLTNELQPLVGLDVAYEVLQGLRVVAGDSWSSSWAQDAMFRHMRSHAEAYVKC